MAIQELESNYLQRYGTAQALGQQSAQLTGQKQALTNQISEYANESPERIANKKFQTEFPGIGTLNEFANKINTSGGKARQRLDDLANAAEEGAKAIVRLLPQIAPSFPNGDGGVQKWVDFRVKTAQTRPDLKGDINTVEAAIQALNQVRNATQNSDGFNGSWVMTELHKLANDNKWGDTAYGEFDQVWQILNGFQNAKRLFTNLTEYRSDNAEKEKIANGNQRLIELMRGSGYNGQAFKNQFIQGLTESDKTKYGIAGQAQAKLTGVSSALQNVEPAAANAVTQANMLKFQREEAMKGMQRADVRKQLYTGSRPTLNTSL